VDKTRNNIPHLYGDWTKESVGEFVNAFPEMDSDWSVWRFEDIIGNISFHCGNESWGDGARAYASTLSGLVESIEAMRQVGLRHIPIG
jgi:hypothetical protein